MTEGQQVKERKRPVLILLALFSQWYKPTPRGDTPALKARQHYSPEA